MIRLQVSDFGPIIEGAVNLKPLTIFVGPNNSGKSYLAVLAYALFRSLPFYAFPTRIPFWRLRRFPFLLSQRRLPGMEDTPLDERFDKDLIKSWQDLIRTHTDEARDGKISIPFENLPDKFRQLLQETLQGSANDWSVNFGDELKRCYSTELFELTRKKSKKGFNISVSQTDPPLLLNTSLGEKILRLDESHFDISKQSVTLKTPRVVYPEKTFTERDPPLLFELLENFLFQTIRQVYRGFMADPYYFPAARSGILQSHKALASYVVGYSPLAGIEKLPEIPRLPGVVADFISKLLNLEKDRRTKLYEIAMFLENEVTRGTIDIEAEKFEYPEIYYQPESGKFPLHRTSSMVSELAPMVLFLKYLIDLGDLVIIEEPESHLHPQSQLELATGIVKLIRAGVTVLITTHSSDFVQQFSNFIRLSQVPEEQRVKQGYSPTDYVAFEEVGAYLFDLNERKGGSVVKELAVTPRDGIPDEEFAKVTEALYKKTVYLDRAVSAK